MDVWFYHLQSRPLEAVLPSLVERSLGRGWKVVVEVGGAERMASLDDHLWTYADDSFLPHVTMADPEAATSPVVLTTGQDNANGAQVRFCVDGARIPDVLQPYERVVLMFDGDDPEALAAARGDWRKLKAAGTDASYWQQDDTGRWEKKA